MQGSFFTPTAGDFVQVRTRRWLVESVIGEDALVRARLACIDDDAQGEKLEVLWRDELDATVIADGHQSVFENPGTQPLAVALPSNPIRGIAGCCARTASGQVTATPTNAMNSRRLIQLSR